MDASGRTHFPSKRDLWLSIVLWSAVVVCVVTGVAMVAADPGPGSWAVLLFQTAIAALILWVLYGTGYTFAGDRLAIRSGPFRFQVPLADVATVEPSRSPLSGPACSLDRLLIRYGTRQILVSPRDRSGFLDALARRGTRLARQGDRLVRS